MPRKHIGECSSAAPSCHEQLNVLQVESITHKPSTASRSAIANQGKLSSRKAGSDWFQLKIRWVNLRSGYQRVHESEICETSPPAN